jgi:monoamine oxidase
VSEEKKRDRGDWTRRGLMQGAGAGALAAAGLGRAAFGAEKGARSPGDYDAIVVGAGFAGATAARELRNYGLRVLVLEARNRIGGRTFTSEVDGHEVELGGAYFHWAQPHAWAEITRYGLEIHEPPPEAPARSAWLASGERREGGPDDLALEAFRGSGAFFYDAMQVFARPFDPLFAPEITEADLLSVQDRLDGLGLPQDHKDVLGGIFSVSCHCNPAEAALTEMLRWFALSGGSMRAYVDAVGRYTLRGGTRTLVERILADARAEVRLSTPVKSVRQTDGAVVVTTEEGESVSARAVVVTVPLNVLGSVEFSPPLSAGKRAIASEGHVGTGVKLHIKVRGRVGSFTGLAPWPAPIASLSTEYSDSEGTMLTAFGPSSKLLDINDDEAIGNALRPLLPGAEVAKAVGYDWNVDRYSRGTWCILRPGQLTRYLPDLQRPEGRVFYAGGDNASGWRGFIDGAIESGIRAGQHVVKLLG